MTFKYLLQKEFLQIRRNAFLPRLIVFFPFLLMCIAPWVMDMEVRNIAVTVVDQEHSSLSTRLTHRIEASPYFLFKGVTASYAEALRQLEQTETDLIVEIPPHFERDRVRGYSPQLLVAANAVNGTKGSIGTAYLSQIITRHVSPESAALEEAVSTLYLYNKHQDYKLFMVPALMAIILMMLCGFLPALNIVSEKEKGTIEAINVTPVSKKSFILAKLVPYWLIALFAISLCFVLAWLLYGITCAGNLAWVYLLAILLALFFSAFGLVVSNYNGTMQQAVFVMWFFVVCLMLLSGLFTPVRSMPDWAYASTYVNPMHYFIDAIRTVYVRGGDFSSIAHQAGALCLFATGMSVWAVGSYRKNGD